jgi:hypothetical protein
VNYNKILTPLESSFIEKQEPYKFREIFEKNSAFFREANRFLDSLRKE